MHTCESIASKSYMYVLTTWYSRNLIKDIWYKRRSPLLLLCGFQKFYLCIYQMYWGISKIHPIGKFFKVFVTYCRCLIQRYQLLLSFWMYHVVRCYNYHSQLTYASHFVYHCISQAISTSFLIIRMTLTILLTAYSID